MDGAQLVGAQSRVNSLALRFSLALLKHELELEKQTAPQANCPRLHCGFRLHSLDCDGLEFDLIRLHCGFRLHSLHGLCWTGLYGRKHKTQHA